MAKVILIQGGNLERYYNQTLKYLQAKYHSSPADLAALSMSSPGNSTPGGFEKLVSEVLLDPVGDVPAGKLVV